MTDWVTPLATFAASLAGAWLAFKLQSLEKRRAIRESHIAAINSALTTLAQHGNTLLEYRNEHIEPHRNSDARHLLIEASLEYDLDIFRFDVPSLNFLSSPAGRLAVLMLVQEENAFRETLRVINDRSLLIHDEVDPKVLAGGLADSSGHDVKNFEQVLGTPLYMALRRKTDDVVERVDYCKRGVDEAIRQLHTVAIERFSEPEIIGVAEMPTD